MLDEDGKVVEEVHILDANLDEIAQRCAGSNAVIETISNYYHSYDTLSEYLDMSVEGVIERFPRSSECALSG